MKQILFIVLALSLVKSAKSQNSSGYDFSSIEDNILKAIESKTIPSAVVAVAKDGKIIYENAFGWADVENQIKATIQTSYQLASVSKPITATGIMILNQEPGFDIHSPAEKYISPLKFKSYEGVSSEVKVLDLLDHTSGLGTYFEINYDDEGVVRVDDFETAFKKYGYLFHPSGLKFEYSNMGYGLLDYIIEKQSGKSFSGFMDDELFSPLGMKNSFVGYPNKKGLTVAKKYGLNQTVLPKVRNNTRGAGNIYSSVHDLILFGMFHLKNGNSTVLNDKSIDLMHSYKNKNALYHYYDATYYGLGWYYKPDDDGFKLVWHEGGMMGISSMIKLIPEKNIAIAVILNTFNQQYCQDITNKLSRIILPDYTPEPINIIGQYKHYTSDSTFFGNWKGTIRVGNQDVPCTLKIKPDGNIIIDYLDFTLKSYFTQGNPLPHKSILTMGQVNENSFIGMFPGDLPSKDIRHEFSQFLSLKLYKIGDVLSGTVVAFAAAEREYYGYPYYIRLERK
ncbi:serine hydrolase domain-containing protein [Xanthovirga aplysinae]|uniref:serine hydrolase domain-containing protein n=1 Tax=Xanthovirga aplysinae TaxID=2529853 RepID=UPI0012BD05C1|nr:serine hydrolase domain-containing protein [Xanthovirga aplysinae]MTI32143.1 class A beta-lactamase-related serine hydrolase [Xanthovirga aplysinae]